MTDDEKQRAVNIVTKSPWAMDRRVSELLDFAKIQIGGLTIKPESLDMVPIMRRQHHVFPRFSRTKSKRWNYRCRLLFHQ